MKYGKGRKERLNPENRFKKWDPAQFKIAKKWKEKTRAIHLCGVKNGVEDGLHKRGSESVMGDIHWLLGKHDKGVRESLVRVGVNDDIDKGQICHQVKGVGGWDGGERGV